MSIDSYLHLLQWGAYASLLAVLLGAACLCLLGVAIVILADIRRRLVVGAVVEPPDPPDPPPALDFPPWVNPSEKRPAA